MNIKGALSAGAVIGIFSWTNVPMTYWLAQALFYSSLSLSVWAVITASQQTTLINALRPTDKLQLEEVYSTAQIILRFRTDLDDIEGYASSYYRGPESLGRKGWTAMNILYVWQSPLMLMSWAWFSLLVGLTLHVCSPLIAGNASRDEVRIAIFYLAVGLGLFVNFLWTSASTYWTSRIIYGMDRFHIDPAEAYSRSTSRNPTGASTQSRRPPNDSVGMNDLDHVPASMSEMSKPSKRDSYSVAYPKRDGTFGQRPV